MSPSERPTITVAIPTMNGSRHLAETIRGVLAQEGVAFEIVVCDDRSEDQTVTLARSLAGDLARIVENSERLGLAGNWNQCVTMSRTPLVAIVHQDDVLRPSHLAAHVAAFAADAGVGLVASASGVIDDLGREVPETVVGRGGLGAADRGFAPGEAVAVLSAGNPLRCSAVSIRAEAHADVGGFDPALTYVVDWDFWIRVAQRWGLAWRAAATVDVRWHLASETHRFKSGTTDLEETERVLEAVVRWLQGQSVATGPIERLARGRLARAYLNRAHDGLKAGEPALARRCLRRSLGLTRGILSVLAGDPRLSAQMAALIVAPRLAARWFGDGEQKAT